MDIEKEFVKMNELEFFDTESGKFFLSSDYSIVEKNGRKLAFAKSPDKTHDCWILLKDDELKKNDKS